SWSPQRTSDKRNHIGVCRGEPQPHRAPKPLVVSQCCAAIRLRADGVPAHIWSNEPATRWNFERGGGRPHDSTHIERGRRHGSRPTHPFVNPRKSIRTPCG